MLSLCCTKVIRDRLCLPPQLPAPVQPSTRLGNWYVHLARFGHQQIVIATSERSLLTVLLPARQLRQTIEISFQAAVAELLDALQLSTKIVKRELAAVQPAACPCTRVGAAILYVARLTELFGSNISFLLRCPFFGLKARSLTSLDRRRMILDGHRP